MSPLFFSTLLGVPWPMLGPIFFWWRPNSTSAKSFPWTKKSFCLPRSTKERGGEFTYPFLFGAKGKQMLYQLFAKKKNMWMIFIYPSAPQDAIVTTRMTKNICSRESVKKNPSFASWLPGLLGRSDGFFFWNRGNSSTDFAVNLPRASCLKPR